MKSLHNKHWLVHVLRRAGFESAESLALDPAMPAPEAWGSVCEQTGLSQSDLAQHVADYFRLKTASLEQLENTAVKLVPEKVARQYSIYPLRENDRQLVVATCDPTNFAAEQALGFLSGRKTVFEVAPPPYILDAINNGYSPDDVIESLLSRVDEEITSSVAHVRQQEQKEVSRKEAESGPVIRLTNLIFRDAVMNGASDIHIEPGPNGATVRFRIDGVLRNYMQLPMPALIRVVSRIKVMGNLDIADRWRPQDGRTRVVVEGRPYDIRISTVPTREAEKVVLRVLKGGEAAKLNEIGLPDWELGRLRQLLANRDGIVCVTGPTGSGKTTTLYAAIRELATGEVNIMTVEDPVEYELPGITQIQVQPKRGVTFASALRAILRQDPDVILVGEIRDLETAEVAVQAAMTGHLVLATLHTNDAVSSIPRLLDIGLDRASISATLRGALAQRLVRRVCDECGEPIRGEMTQEEARLAKLYNIRPPIRSVGCRRCAEAGYRGRLPVQEVFLANSAIGDMISGGATFSELYDAASASGMRSLMQVGLERVRNGETTLDELERVLGLEAEESRPTETIAPPRSGREPLDDPRHVRQPEREREFHDSVTYVDRQGSTGGAGGSGEPGSLHGAGVAASGPREPGGRAETVGAGPVEAGEPTGAGAAQTGGALDPGAGREEEPSPHQTQLELEDPVMPGEDLEALIAAAAAGESAEAAAKEKATGARPAAAEQAEQPEQAEPFAPGASATEPVVPPAQSGVAGPPGSPEGASQGGEERILVVDDDPEDRLLVRTLLQKHGYRVDEASNGAQALEQIGEGGSHSMVILDLEMPEMDGRQVLGRLRSAGVTLSLPVVVLTGSPDPDDEYRVMEAGADDYLRKPVDPPRFIARVKATLRRARMG